MCRQADISVVKARGRGKEKRLTECVDAASEGGEDPGVPTLVGVVEQGVDGIADDKGIESIGEIAHGHGVVLLGLALSV